ncbi:MAG: response regulator transcription factor [Candidatus Obscuribacterales bacterium]|nr:response regulator transcription factor [Candidatus Obscuribacterales bacterium]
MAKILVVEDDNDTAKAVLEFLQQERYNTEICPNGDQALDLLAVSDYDLLILDWNLPGASGFEICQAVRNKKKTVPILMLTGNQEVSYIESVLDAGADDYLTKPFRSKELLARVRALLRRAAGLTSHRLEINGITLDSKSGKVLTAEAEISLTAQEFLLLEFLVRNKGQAFSTEAILARVWNSDSETSPDAVRQSIRRLRTKLDTIGQANLISTVAGIGYRID